MTSWTLAVSGIVQLVTFASFAYVGGVLSRRHSTEPGARLAQRAVTSWWWGLGAYLGMLGVLDLLAVVGVTSLALHIVARVLGVALLAICAWGFSTYVLFLYSGSANAARWTAVYGVLAGLLFYVESWVDHPTSVVVSTSSAGLAPPADPALLRVVYAFFALPLLASIIAYASLYRRVTEPLQRYRVALVSASLFAWVLGGFFGSSLGGTAEFVSVTVLGLVASIAVLLAYRPPTAILARLAPDSPEAARRDSRREELRERMGQLI